MPKSSIVALKNERNFKRLQSSDICQSVFINYDRAFSTVCFMRFAVSGFPIKFMGSYSIILLYYLIV